MAEEIVKARVWTKIDTQSGWDANPLILGPGEFAPVLTAPGGSVFNFKVGTGDRRFSDLPWSLQNPGAAQEADTSTVFPTGVPGLYIPTENGTYEGVTVDLSVGYVQLIWDGSNLVKVEFPIDLSVFSFIQNRSTGDPGNELSLKTARENVAISDRKAGHILTIRTSQSNDWAIWQYSGAYDENDSPTGWNDDNSWRLISTYTNGDDYNKVISENKGYSFFNSHQIIRGWRLDTVSTGVVASDTSEITPYISVSGIDKIYYSGETPLVDMIAVAGYEYPDGNNPTVLVNGLDGSNVDGASMFDNYEVIIPSGVRYIRAWSRDKSEVNISGKTLNLSLYPATPTSDYVVKEEDLFVRSEYTYDEDYIGYRFNAAGNTTESATGALSGFIDVSKAHEVVYSGQVGELTAAVVGYDIGGSKRVLLMSTEADRVIGAGWCFINRKIPIPNDIVTIQAWARYTSIENWVPMSLVVRSSKLKANSNTGSSKRRYFTIGSPTLVTTPIQASGISPSMTLSDVYDVYEGLLSSYPDFVTKETLGQDGVGNDIYCYSFGYKLPTQLNSSWVSIPWDDNVSNQLILINSGIHGNEQGATMATALMMKYICDTNDTSVSYIKNNATLKVIPCLNPSGFIAGTRENHNGVDLNRDFTDKTQIETNICCDFITANSRASLMIDCHSNTLDRYVFVIKEGLTSLRQIMMPIGNSLKNDWSTTLPSSDKTYIDLLNASDGTMKDFMLETGIDGMSIETINIKSGTGLTDFAAKAFLDMAINAISSAIQINS